MTANILLKSSALIIDDEILDKRKRAYKMREVLEKEGCIFITRERLLEDETIDSLSGISFMILDWKLNEKESSILPEGVQVGTELIHSQEKQTKEFIKKVLARYFIPIFIFSQESITQIKKSLKDDSDISKAVDDGRVSVKSKMDLSGDKIKTYLSEWLENNSTTHGLKLFEKKLNEAKNNFFVEVGNYSQKWLSIIFSLIKKEHNLDFNGKTISEINTLKKRTNSDLTEFILSSFLGRLDSAEFENINFTDEVISENVIKPLFNSIKFYQYNQDISGEESHEGEIYQKVIDGNGINEYIINITASCDLRDKKLLMIKGSVPNYNTCLRKDGDLKKKESSNYIPLLLQQHWIEFPYNSYFRTDELSDFGKITVSEGGNVMSYIRIGRLVHPYITNLRNDFVNYVSRQGFHRHPNQKINKTDGRIDKYTI